MDALSLIHPGIERTDGYWIGRLSACIAENAVRTKDKRVRQSLSETSREFMQSAACTDTLRKILQDIR